MGKRGPHPREAIHTGVRLAADLRQRLEKAAAKNGVTLSREIEGRLYSSFSQTEKMHELFGGQLLFQFFLRIANVIKSAERVTEKAWWEDRFTFDAMRAATDAALEVVQPKGRSVPPAHIQTLPPLVASQIANATEFGRSLMLVELSAVNDNVRGLGRQEMSAASFFLKDIIVNRDSLVPLVQRTKKERQSRRSKK